MMIRIDSQDLLGGIFLSSTLLFVYPFLIYPIILRLLARRFPWQPAAPKENPEAFEPRVALVICALNEGKIIREKLENTLKLNYPADLLHIVVISDGSTDNTVEIAREYCGSGIELIEHKVRRGKVANINSIVPALSEEIVVLSDANVIYHQDSIRALVRRFADPEVGCVSGKVVLTDHIAALDNATEGYYSFEWRLQEDATKLYGMPGADGAMYAFRRDLFETCRPDTLIEDFIIPLAISRRGKRTILEPLALGWEKGVTSLPEEFRRKVRIAAGAMQGLLRGTAWPRGAGTRFWFVFVSHKLLRWLSPFTGVLAAASAVLLMPQLRWLVLAGALLVGLLTLTRLLTTWKHPLLDGPFYFLFSQVAVGVGLIKGLFRLQSVLWAKADR